MTPFPKTTLPRLVRDALARPRDELLVERVDGTWTPTSSERLLQRVESVAAALRSAGLAEGDRVALIAHDCVDWIVAAVATLFAGCVVVPIYPTQALDQTSYILAHSGATMLFVDTPLALERLRAIPSLPRAIVFEGDGDGSLHAFESAGAALPPVTSSAGPDDLAVLVYTSGTTGDPKGVMLTHDNIAFDALSSEAYGFSGHEGDDVLSVLPFSHVYEHTMVYIYLVGGVRYFICHDPSELLADLTDVRPVTMTAVPRIFDRVLAGVAASALARGGVQARLVPWALRVGREHMHATTFGGGASVASALRYALAKALVLKRLRKRLGLDRTEYLTSGSAPLHVDTAMTFLGLGVPIMQGYGQTETSPVVSVSCLDANEYGAVGKPIPGVEVRLAPDGEILTRGRHVMKGYYRDDAATEAAIRDGWLYTGDVGTLDDAGFLRVTDRKGEVFKTAGGKFVSPARVESAIKRSVFVTQAMVIGEGRAHPIALVNANWPLVRATRRGDELAFLSDEVARQTADLATFEQVHRIVVVPEEFTVESGLLSPAMKIKRRVAEQRYAGAIEAAYRAMDSGSPTAAFLA
jgi:long-chain acyl-CoA synthetase